MYLAAMNGHLEVVQWLHENRTEGCDRDTILEAAAKDHFQVIQFLYLNCIEETSRDAMICPLGDFNVEMYQWLREKALTDDLERRGYVCCD